MCFQSKPFLVLSFVILLSLPAVDSCANAESLATDSPAVPNDAELAARQARIGRIDIQVDDVFEGAHLATPYRLVNALHIDSRPATIAVQLLFHSGDLYERRVLDETERLLRGQRYLNGATIQPIEYHEDTNTVDLSVRVHDVWTLSSGFSYGRKGGANNSSVEIEENNLLGFGKRIELAFSNNVDRSSSQVRYYDPNVLGSRWRLSTAYASSSDGAEKTIDVMHPFYALDTRWSADVFATDTNEAVSRYSHGEIVEQFSMHKSAYELGGGISDGLDNGWVRRFMGGVRYQSREFTPYHQQAASIPEDRVVTYPWLGLELLEDKFLKTQNLDLIGRTEDIHLGGAAYVEAGYAAKAFGSTESAFILHSNLSFGSEFGERQYVLSAVGAEGRIGHGTIDNGIFDFSSRYFFRQTPHSVFYASASATVTSNLDPEAQLLLGGDNGLRGYPLRYQAGTSRALVTAEERLYTNWQPLKLFTVGAAAFVDVGRTWGHDEFGGEQFGWLKDVGIGLRLGNARSALGNVLHIDLAFPLDGPTDIAKLQVVVETKRSF